MLARIYYCFDVVIFHISMDERLLVIPGPSRLSCQRLCHRDQGDDGRASGETNHNPFTLVLGRNH